MSSHGTWQMLARRPLWDERARVQRIICLLPFGLAPNGHWPRKATAAPLNVLTMSTSMSSISGRRTSPAVAPTSGLPYGYVPAYLPGSASLVEQLDQELLIVLRDGRHLVGVRHLAVILLLLCRSYTFLSTLQTLRSFDQFSNMILEDTSERRMCTVDGKIYYASVPLGLYVVRGDSMVLMGEIDDTCGVAKEVSLEELEERIEQAKKEELEWDFDTDLVA